jgi:hypothetical protein
VQFFHHVLLRCGIKKCDERAYNLDQTAQKKKRAESTQLAYPLGTTCGPPVEEHL